MLCDTKFVVMQHVFVSQSKDVPHRPEAAQTGRKSAVSLPDPSWVRLGCASHAFVFCFLPPHPPGGPGGGSGLSVSFENRGLWADSGPGPGQNIFGFHFGPKRSLVGWLHNDGGLGSASVFFATVSKISAGAGVLSCLVFNFKPQQSLVKTV